MFRFLSYFLKSQVYTLDEISVNNMSASHGNLRKHTKIAVIDDNKFSIGDLLARSEFEVHEVGDIQRLEVIEAYPIIICDIKGVGKHFGSDKEGAFVMSEIRKKYPDKYIIAYSSGSSNLSFQEYLKSADISLMKATSIEEWVSVLDEAINTMNDPIKRWIRFRNKLLLDHNIDLYYLHLLQQGYIKSLREKRIDYMKYVFEKKEIKNTNISLVINSFISVTLKSIIDNM